MFLISLIKLHFGLSIITGFEMISQMRKSERERERERESKKELANKQVDSLCSS